MLFTTPLFLFLFLPLVLGLYFISPGAIRNSMLCVASVVFYAWGEGVYVVVLLGSVLINYLGALGLGYLRESFHRRALLWTTVLTNLLLLIVFKYSHFLAVNVNLVLVRFHHPLPEPSLHLPIGISFFTFMGLAYVIDSYRRQIEAQKQPLRVALYLTLFPHLIAGPIVRYGDIATEIVKRHVGRSEFAEGVRRFVIGLGKKMLIANTLALTVDLIFKTPIDLLTPAVAWLGIAAYALQIYFDFSGYSDMAIGLARMFGFHFPENFNFPYIAESLTDFWRRWHITLSHWLRDYLYFPLGVRHPRWRLYLNLLIVFFLCGLWHGANWTFVVWGLCHGGFLVFERMGLANWMSARARIFRHAYTLLVILVGWVFFRAETVSAALSFLRVMAGLGHSGAIQPGLSAYLNYQLLLAFVLGSLGSTPLVPSIQKTYVRFVADSKGMTSVILQVGGRLLRVATLAVVFVASATLSGAGTYSPFIYFRF